jgi:hypothetical protein
MNGILTSIAQDAGNFTAVQDIVLVEHDDWDRETNAHVGIDEVNLS